MVMLYLVRHGVAQEARRGMADEARALTAEGVRKFRGIARAFVGHLGGHEPHETHGHHSHHGGGHEISHLLSSPLLRARQTAAILAEVLEEAGGNAEVSVEHALSTGDLRQFLKSVGAFKHARGVVAVGHEPIMGHWIGQLCFQRKGKVEVKKGAVAGIELLRGNKGELRWLMQPGNWEVGR